jgi:hypothetical protein
MSSSTPANNQIGLLSRLTSKYGGVLDRNYKQVAWVQFRRTQTRITEL